MPNSVNIGSVCSKGWTIRYPGRGGVRSKKKTRARN